MELIKYCKVCGGKIPEMRIKLGYRDTCVNHSTTKKFSAFISSKDECDYEVSIIRSEETEKRIRELKLNNIYY